MRKPIIWIAGTAGAIALIGAGTAVAFATGTAELPFDADDVGVTQTDDRLASGAPSDIEGAIAAALKEAGPGVVIDADIDDNAAYAYEIDVRQNSGGIVEVKLDENLKVVSAQPDDRGAASGSDDGVPDAADAKKASDAALAHVGSGTVTSVELSDDADHVYEVEIDLGDGKDVDVELDGAFTVVKAD